ncbi:hypothetical protein QU593_10060 [Rossellomorea marisflavi]|uniref:hypothetical protein n=1 Tax=Rossellomorea marisflavi TaxID=189381 RepID=UPI0025B272B5|nr:hypothetical protein [Rossellomorea marisflavi]WJV20748.1 hypothetical protein QU593_10060 [Rossellomorea marisflavi]
MKGICVLTSLICLLLIGCSEEKIIKESNSQEEQGHEIKPQESRDPEVSDNCEEVYSEEECKQFVDYYNSEEGQLEGSQKEGESNISSNRTDILKSEEDVYEYVVYIIDQILHGSDNYTLAPMQDFTIVKRDDGLFYVNSSFYTGKDSASSKTNLYFFEFLISENREIKDGYIPGSVGMYSTPMKYDEVQEFNRQQMEQNKGAEQTELEREEMEQKENERQVIMDSIYGDEQEIDMNEEYFGE